MSGLRHRQSLRHNSSAPLIAVASNFGTGIKVFDSRTLPFVTPEQVSDLISWFLWGFVVPIFTDLEYPEPKNSTSDRPSTQNILGICLQLSLQNGALWRCQNGRYIGEHRQCWIFLPYPHISVTQKGYCNGMAAPPDTFIPSGNWMVLSSWETTPYHPYLFHPDYRAQHLTSKSARFPRFGSYWP